MKTYAAKTYAAAVAVAAVAFAAPATARDIEYHLKGKEAVTLVNLHPDEAHKRLYSLNYQQEGLMPACTKVRILSVTHKAMTLEVGGAKYEYAFHEATKEPIAQHLDRYFGTSCPKAKIDALTGINKRGFTEGRVLPGMTKDAVILAVGYPPQHATPKLDFSLWKYWRNRFMTTQVHFDGNKVSKVD
jgi:hypothetical protein